MAFLHIDPMTPQPKPEKRMTYREKMRSGMIPRKPRKRVKAVSAKRQKEGQQYSRLRKEFLRAHPTCQVEGCNKLATDIHHKARRGKNYLNTDTWMAVDRECHERIETNAKWARDKGYLTR